MNDRPAIFSGRIAVLATLASVSLPVSIAYAEDLGLIQVESTTIDERFDSRRKEPSSVGVIGGDTVDQAHAESVQQLLQRVPGITTEVQSGDSIKIHIRGVENQRYMGEKPGVAVVIDGVPVFERTGRVNIDLDNIESIKVIKGGASYLFGDDALSGAVVITTKRGAKQAGFKLAGEAGSFGYYKGLVRAGIAGEKGSGHVQISRREADGYYDDSASKADYVDGKAQYYVDDVSDLTFGFEISDRAKNSHGSVKGVSAAASDPRSTDVLAYNDYANHYDVSLAKYYLTYSRDVGAADNLMVNVYSFADDTAFLSAPTRSDPRAYTYDNNYHQVQRGLKAEYRAGGETTAWLLATDLRANRYENEVLYAVDVAGSAWSPAYSAGDTKSKDDTDEAVHAVYGELKYRVSEPLVVSLNGRFDHLEYDYADQTSTLRLNKSFDVSSWRLGGNYALNDNLDIYGNASTGFRAPTMEQLFAGSISPTGDTASNPDLKPEQALNLELGLRSRTTLFGAPSDLELAMFQIDRSDFILASAGQYAQTANGVKDRYENIGGARNRGVELSLHSVPSNKWSWDLGYTYLDARFTRYDNFNLTLGNTYKTFVTDCSLLTDPANQWCVQSYDNSGNQVPRTPRHHLNLALAYRPAPYWTVTGELDTYSSYFADETNLIQVGGYSTYNLLLNYDRRVGQNTWSLFARVDNLFDRRYYNTARGFRDQNSDGVYDGEDLSIVVNQGRTYTAGVSVTF